MSTFPHPPAEGGSGHSQHGEDGDIMPSRLEREAGTAKAPTEPEPTGGGVDAEWEMSKENVLPLARGRKVESIRRAFGGPASYARGGGEVEAAGGGGGTAGVRAALKRSVARMFSSGMVQV